MNDYSDLFLVIGASIIFAVLLIDVNATVVRENKYKADREIEYTAITLAQDVIDKARWVPYNQFNSTYANTDSLYNTPLGDYRVTTSTSANTLSGLGITNNHIRLDVKVRSLFSSDSVLVLLSYVKNG